MALPIPAVTIAALTTEISLELSDSPALEPAEAASGSN